MFLLAPIRLVARVASRFRAERLGQTAAALSFATLIGLVPMIAIAAALLEHLPFAQAIGTALQKFLLANLLPDKAGAVIAKYVAQFANRAERVTLAGIAVLAATALMQMLTMERTFNSLWRVKAARPLVKRLVIHALALLIGPLVFGGSLAMTTFLASASLGVVAEPEWITNTVFRGLSVGFLALLLAIVYWGVPRRAVVPWHAFAGGLAAALAFVAMQRLFGIYVAKLPTYTLIYGTFAAVPIFLVWLYLSWSVILIGALITAEMPAAARPPRPRQRAE